MSRLLDFLLPFTDSPIAEILVLAIIILIPYSILMILLGKLRNSKERR